MMPASMLLLFDLPNAISLQFFQNHFTDHEGRIKNFVNNKNEKEKMGDKHFHITNFIAIITQ